MLEGHVYTMPSGARGFDCNTKLTAAIAQSFARHGYDYAVRYVRRAAFHTYDLDIAEAAAILSTGLALMPVQHVESADSWVPTRSKGAQYGETAATECEAIGISAGVTVWCDLEGVKPGTPHDDVIAYANAWHAAVASRGFVPGLYIGWHCGLNAHELYSALRFTHYWAAYNLNTDQYPAVRGVQMQQSAAKHADKPPGVSFEIDVDRVMVDKLRGLPTALGPMFWAATVQGLPSTEEDV